MNLLQFTVFLTLAAAEMAALFFPSRWQFAVLLGGIATVLAAVAGIVAVPGFVIIAIGGGLVYVCRRPPLGKAWYWLTALLVFCFALGTHKLPGIHNLLIADSAAVAGGASPLSFWANFDKGITGLLLLLAWPQDVRGARWTLARGLGFAVVAAGLMLALGWITGFITLQPTLHPLTAMFLFVNFAFVVVPETAFFQGVIARGLMLRLAPWIAIGITALLYAVTHAGDPRYLALVAIAGVIETTLYMLTKRVETGIVAHFLTNTGRFILFNNPLI